MSEFSKQISINGVMNVKTIDAVNSIEDQSSLFERISKIRKDYYTKLAINTDGSHTKNYVFLRGWLNRVDNCLRGNIND